MPEIINKQTNKNNSQLKVYYTAQEKKLKLLN